MKVRLKSPDNLIQLLIQKGYSQRSYASHIGLSYEYFNRIVKEHVFPSGTVARKIYEGLDLEFQDLFFLQNGDDCNQ
jgi:DNA-binding XRE family transcriptional regulator